MENELKIRIVGDASGLEAATDSAQKSLASLNSSIQKIENDIVSNIKITQGYENAIENLGRELKAGGITQDQYGKSLKRLKRDEQETAIETASLRKELSLLQKNQRVLTGAIANSSGAQKGLKRDIRGTTPTMLEFNRVIQDAPFGIIGVGNNIQQLTANFAILRRNAGGTGAAMKALVGSFAGPAGILFAVSAVTSLITVYGDELFNAKSGTEKLKEETEKNKEALNNYIESLRGVEKSTLDASKSAAQEQITLKNLRKQIEDTTISTDKREDAIEKLRKTFPAYFQDVSNEQLLNGQAASSYDVLTNSITKRAKATAALDLLVENAKTELDVSKRLLQIEKDLQKTQEAKVLAKEEEDRLNKSIGSNRGATTGAQLNIQGKISKLTSEENDLIKERLRLFQQIGEAQLDNIDLQNQITANIVVEPEVKTPDKTPEIGVRPIVEKIDVVDFGTGLTDLPPIKITADTTGLKEINPDIDGLNKKLANTLIAADAFNAGVSASFATLASQASNSLATGVAVLDSFLGAFLDSLAQVAAAMLQQAILDKLFSAQKLGTNIAQSNANAVTIATNAAAALGPLGAIALPGLIASQLAVVNTAFAAIPKFKDGGIIGGGSSVGDQLLIRANSGERILTNSDQDFLSRFLRGDIRNNFADENITVTGVLRGTDILLSNKRSERNNRRFGA